jgi:threonine dehydrogenase-like Zn-dependent dehydrogenase
MKAVVWHGKRDVRVDEVPDPVIREPDDIVIQVTSTGICGSDLHLYEVLAPFMTEGDILGHEPMGIVAEVGPDITTLAVGDRVVIPFNIACGHCFMCDRGLMTQCETTQVRDQGKGAALFGYTKLYGQVPGGQAEYLRVPQAGFGPIVVPPGPPDDRYVYLSDVLPTAWQAVEYAAIPPDGSVAILGLGPIGDMSTRIARYRGAGTVIGVDLVPERLARAAGNGVTTVDASRTYDVAEALRDLTDGRGPDAVIDAVGMEAHGSTAAGTARQTVGLLPGGIGEKVMTTGGVDRMTALRTAIDAVRRGGTVSLSGVYGGMADPLPMMVLFDKQIQLRMGQANVRRWIGDIMPLLSGDDVLGVDRFATHRLSLAEAPRAYADFQAKRDGAVKILLQP